GTARASHRVRDGRVVVPAGDGAFEAGQQAPGVAAVVVQALPGLDRAPADVEVFPGQAGNGGHDAVARVVGAGRGHGDAEVRHRRRRHARFVGAASPDEFDAATVVAGELAVELAHRAVLARLGNQVDILRVVEFANRIVARRRGVRRTSRRTAAGRVIRVA